MQPRPGPSHGRAIGAALSPRAAALLALLVLAACVAVLHREVLFEGRVYHMDDAADGYYPGHIAALRAYAHGELPTWERGSWCGFPLVVDPYNGVFYPPNAIYALAGPARGLGFAIALHVLLGGLGLYALGRLRRLAFAPALFGAIAYALSSFGVVRIRHVIFVQMMGWLPWILVGIERWMETRRVRALAFTALATGLALLAGALSIGHFAALAIAGYAAARCAPEPGRRARATRFFVDVGALSAAAICGALLACAQIVPTLAHLPDSPRHLASDYRFASSYAWPTLRYALTLLRPDAFGGEDRATYVGAPNHWELCGYYSGALPVLVAPLALLLRGRRRGRDGELVVLFGLLLLAMGLALGDAGPLHPFFYRHVPLYASLRCPARALLIAVLAVPILAATGLDRLLAALATPRSPDRGRLVAYGALVACLAVVGLLVGATPPSHGALVSRLRAATHEGALYLHAMHAISLASLVGIAVLAAGAIAGATSILRRDRLALGLGALACLVAAWDLLATDRAYVSRDHQPADYPAGMERFAAVEWLLAHDPRTASDGEGGGDRFVNDPRGPFRLHNLGLVLGLESPSGYDSVAPWRYVELLEILKTGRRYPHRELRDDVAGIGVWNLASPILDLMNVRWLIAAEAPPGPARSGGPPRFVERFHPVPPTGSPAAAYEPFWDAQLKVFENTHALPRAFIAHRAEVLGDDALAARIASPAFAPGEVALLEEPPGVALDGRGGPPTPTRMVSQARQRLVIDTDDPRPGVLVVSDAFARGWSATVDGAPATLLRADFAFRGVALPAGRHRVELRYRSRSTELGLALTAVGALLALLACLAGGRSRRAGAAVI